MSSRGCCITLSKLIMGIILSISRTACVSYIVMVGYGIVQIHELLQTSYELDGTTYYIPLMICEPSSVQTQNPIDGLMNTASVNSNNNSISNTANTIPGCHAMDWMIYGIALLLFVSACFVFLYVVFDLVPAMKRSFLSGMSLVLPLLVGQAVVMVWALLMEIQEITKSTLLLWAKVGLTDMYKIDTIRTHGSTTFLWITGWVGCAVVVMLWVESVMNFCVGDKQKKKDAPQSPAPPLNRNSGHDDDKGPLGDDESSQRSRSQLDMSPATEDGSSISHTASTPRRGPGWTNVEYDENA